MKEGWKTLRCIIRYYKPHKIVVIIMATMTLLSVVADFIYPYIIQHVFRNVELIINGRMTTLIIFVLTLVGIWVYEVLYDYIIFYKFDLVLDRIQQQIELDIFEKYLSLSHKYYDNHNVGDLLSTLVHDVKLVRRGLFSLPIYSLRTVLRILAGLFVFPSLSFPLYLACAPVIITSVVILIRGTKIEERACQIYRKKQSAMTSFFEDRLSGIRTIISFGMSSLEKERAFECTENCRLAQTKKWKSRFIINSAYTFIHNWLWLIILVGGVVLLKYEMIDISTILAFEISAYLIADPFCQLSILLEDMTETFVGFGRIQEVLNEKPDIVESCDCYSYPFHGDIYFDDVTFKYENRNVLNKLNLHIKEGEYVAIVGDSGGGKSTIANLIPRYYDVNSGYIWIDDVDVQEYTLQYLRQNIGVVSQDVFLFSDTVLENIRIAKPDATYDEVIVAAKQANAHEFIEKLPNGYMSMVGERGVKLSGGQKQRIAIARCILINPLIFIFDEATSALDNYSEKKIQEAIESIHGTGCTIIVIAHRLSTIKNADRIVVIDNGKISEEGTHDELLDIIGGKYAHLYSVNE